MSFGGGRHHAQNQAVPAYEDGYKNIRPIPDHLKFCGIPEDINSFITDLLPNMRFYVSLRLLTFGSVKADHVDEIINNFVLYILGRDRYGTPRYRRYEVDRFPGMQYHKWFLNHLKYFYLTHKQEMLAEHLFLTLECNDDGDEQDLGLEAEPDLLAAFGSADRGVFGLHELSELYYRDTDWTCFQEFVGIVREISRNARKGHLFEENAFRLLMHKLGGRSTSEFAREMGLSDVAICKWMRKMKQLLIAYLNGEGIDPTNFEEDISGINFSNDVASRIVMI